MTPRDPHPELDALLEQCLIIDRAKIRAKMRQRGAHEDLLRDASRAAESCRQRLSAPLSIAYPPDLPISGRREEILEALRSSRVVVLAGETGSGKTTQIPKMCLEAGLGDFGIIGCTQPRRVAAFSASKRLAEELKVPWGRQVGCKVRFRDHTHRDTRIKVMTDGILLAETQGDRDLLAYSAIVIDEAHERSLNIDFLLGSLRLLLERRSDLHVVITSATIDTERFAAAFNAPIIEVSGRLFPVEIRYDTTASSRESEGDLTYVDASVQAASKLLRESHTGDLLVFLPTEKDIRETCDRLAGAHRQCEVIPLYGRLSMDEQQRVFAASVKRKVVVATNIAETSLTIPGIRYVVDTGLARLSRYSPRTRTRRLPIEPVSQSSLSQRAGRAGRVEAGVCIRLFPEESFHARAEFTLPEIQRANLAEVILRMKFLRLCEVSSFPFLDPPAPHAVRSGFQLLHELGAIDDRQELTAQGKELARLPVDPTVGRMILQAKRESCLHEILVISSALSIMDPRERPSDQREAADRAHARFVDPSSDFLTVLNIWNEYHTQWEELQSQNQLRKFCRTHFLSYMRMREWRDVYEQLEEMVQDEEIVSDPSRFGTEDARYDAIHRSILSGLLGHIAQRIDRNLYKGSHNRELAITPGSALFEAKRPAASEATPRKRSKGSQWIVSGEIVETSKLYARMVAKIDPRWIAEIGSHICRFTYDPPHWHEASGRVVTRQRVIVHGMEVDARTVSYDRVNREEAHEIFIRSALMDEERQGRFNFASENLTILHSVREWQHRTRRYDIDDPEERLVAFYRERLPRLSSIQDLSAHLRRHPDLVQQLIVREEDLTGGVTPHHDRTAFPTQIDAAVDRIAVTYSFAPGSEDDGVTLKIPERVLPELVPEMLDGAIPGIREEQIRALIHALPKRRRSALAPVDETARTVASALASVPGDLFTAARAHIRATYGVELSAEEFSASCLPPHLRPRIVVTGSDGAPLRAARDLYELKTSGVSDTSPTLARLRATHEREEITTWDIEMLPECLEVNRINGVPTFAWFGLMREGDRIALRLFASRDAAESASREGCMTLCERALRKEFDALRRDLSKIVPPKALHAPLAPIDVVRDGALRMIRRFACTQSEYLPLERSRFDAMVSCARERLLGRGLECAALVTRILELRLALVQKKQVYSGMAQNLSSLLPSNFLDVYELEELRHIPRYLQAMLIRCERAAQNPKRDCEHERIAQEYERRIEAMPGDRHDGRLRQLRWMVRELRVSLFAQELGTAFPVSQKKIDRALVGEG